MSTFFEELEAQLRDAAHERVEQRSRRSRSLGRAASLGRGTWLGRGVRGGIRAAPVILAAAVTIAVAVAAIVFLRHAPQPSTAPSASTPQLRALDAQLHRMLGPHEPPHLAQELLYIQTASSRAEREARACRVTEPQSPLFVPGSPGRSLLSMLGVLRRPAAPAERVNVKQLGVSAGGYYRGYGRQVRLGPRSRAYVLAQRSDPAAGQPGPGCLAANRTALQQMLATIPPALRAPTLALQARLLAYGRHLVDGPPHDAVCFALIVGRFSTGESCGLTVSAIRAGEAFQASGSMYTGLVPDGVASVTLRYPAAPGRPARSFTGKVHSNIFAIRVGARYANALHGWVWRSSTGHVVRSVAPPPPDEAQRYCRAHEIRCISLAAAVQVSSSGSGGSRTASRAASKSATPAPAQSSPGR